MSSITFSTNTAARRFYLVMGFIILLAWGLLAAWQGSAYAELLGHEALESGEIPYLGHLAAFVFSWFLMTVAMMLPGSLPMLIHTVQPRQGRRLEPRPVEWIVFGYLTPWIAFGLVLFVGDSYLHELAEPGAPLAALSAWIAPAVVLVAGLYQLTPAKRRSLNRCRTLDNQAEGDNGEGMPGAYPRGLRQGLACLGSCWSLMLVMFALAPHRLDWMLALGLLMAAERIAPWGGRLASGVGAALLLWGLFWALALAGLPLF